MKSGVSGSLFRRLVERGLDVLVLELLVFTVALRSRVVRNREDGLLLLCKLPSRDNKKNVIIVHAHDHYLLQGWLR